VGFLVLPFGLQMYRNNAERERERVGMNDEKRHALKAV
jgi:hypothetical protein